jgi:hypothetical protein
MTFKFCFAIPLKSQVVSLDWKTVERVLSRTLRSILNQSAADFRVFVACHEIPDIRELADPRVEILQAQFDVPLYNAEFMIDKHRKRELIAARWRALGGGYMMSVDADDLVSNRLVEYISTQPLRRGFLVTKGYDLNERMKKINFAPRFYRVCGTNCVINWHPDELPAQPFQREHVLFRESITHGNVGTVSFFARRGEAFAPIPFPAVIYVRSHGDNATDVLHTEGWKRRLIRAISPSVKLDARFAKEFAMEVDGIHSAKMLPRNVA